MGYEAFGQTFFDIDPTTGQVSNFTKGTSPEFISIAGDACGGEAFPYGDGCSGSGGFIPVLGMSGCPVVGEQVQLQITNALGGSQAILLFGLGQAQIPVGSGCDLLVGVLFPATLSLPLQGSGPGTGTLVLATTVPPAVAGVTLDMQAFVLDPANAIGASATNGLEMIVPL